MRIRLVYTVSFIASAAVAFCFLFFSYVNQPKVYCGGVHSRIRTARISTKHGNVIQFIQSKPGDQAVLYILSHESSLTNTLSLYPHDADAFWNALLLLDVFSLPNNDREINDACVFSVSDGIRMNEVYLHESFITSSGIYVALTNLFHTFLERGITEEHWLLKEPEHAGGATSLGQPAGRRGSSRESLIESGGAVESGEEPAADTN